MKQLTCVVTELKHYSHGVGAARSNAAWSKEVVNSLSCVNVYDVPRGTAVSGDKIGDVLASICSDLPLMLRGLSADINRWRII